MQILSIPYLMATPAIEHPEVCKIALFCVVVVSVLPLDPSTGLRFGALTKKDKNLKC